MKNLSDLTLKHKNRFKQNRFKIENLQIDSEKIRKNLKNNL